MATATQKQIENFLATAVAATSPSIVASIGAGSTEMTIDQFNEECLKTYQSIFDRMETNGTLGLFSSWYDDSEVDLCFLFARCTELLDDEWYETYIIAYYGGLYEDDVEEWKTTKDQTVFSTQLLRDLHSKKYPDTFLAFEETVSKYSQALLGADVFLQKLETLGVSIGDLQDHADRADQGRIEIEILPNVFIGYEILQGYFEKMPFANTSIEIKK